MFLQKKIPRQDNQMNFSDLFIPFQLKRDVKRQIWYSLATDFHAKAFRLVGRNEIKCPDNEWFFYVHEIVEWFDLLKI